MIKQTITYTDYDGNERTEDFYFHLNKPELLEMQFSEKGGLGQYIERAAAAQDNGVLLKVFKELLLASYGEKSIDGKQFVKSPELSTAFSQTPAYEWLYMRLAMDTEFAIEFCNNLIPPDLRGDPDKPAAQPSLLNGQLSK